MYTDPKRHLNATTVYRGRDKKWYWREIARNGKETGASEQGYASRAYAVLKAYRYGCRFPFFIYSGRGYLDTMVTVKSVLGYFVPKDERPL